MTFWDKNHLSRTVNVRFLKKTFLGTKFSERLFNHHFRKGASGICFDKVSKKSNLRFLKNSFLQ